MSSETRKENGDNFNLELLIILHKLGASHPKEVGVTLKLNVLGFNCRLEMHGVYINSSTGSVKMY